MQISKLGNSLAVRLPTKLCRELGLKQGDEIQLCATKDRQVFELVQAKSTSLILRELREFRGRLLGEDQLSRDDANAR